MIAADRAREVAIFLACGGVAAGANYISRFAFDVVVPFEAAVVLAYGVGMVVAFILFREHAFPGGSGSTARQVFRFCVVNAVGAALAVLVSALLARTVFPAIGWTYQPYAVAHAFGIAVPAVSSYFGHKYYTYAS